MSPKEFTMPKCPQCSAEEQGRVVRLGESQKAAYCPNYFDSEGKEHSHNENAITSTYECQARHRWSERHVAKCWCGWPSAEEEFKVLNPGQRYEAKEAKFKRLPEEKPLDKQQEPAKVEG
jgi:hypothetical protein